MQMPSATPQPSATKSFQLARCESVSPTASNPAAPRTTMVAAGKPARKTSAMLHASKATHLTLMLALSFQTQSRTRGSQAPQQMAPRCCACEAK